MSTRETESPVGQPPEQPPADAPGAAPEKHRNWGIWVSAGIAVIAVGLLVWGLDNRSEAESAKQDAAAQEAQVEQSKQTGGAVVDTFQAAYEGLKKQLGLTTDDLADTQQDLDNAQKDAADAQKDAAAAQEDAAQAKSETDKANAQVDAAKAEAEAAGSKAAIAADCAKASVSAIGVLFEGDSVADQLQAAGKQLQGIAGDCKAALAGS